MVEKNAWNFANGCTWTVVGDKQVLTTALPASSSASNTATCTSFISLSVHNYMRWVDVSTGPPPLSESIATRIHPDSYPEGKPPRDGPREAAQRLRCYEAQRQEYQGQLVVAEGQSLDH